MWLEVLCFKGDSSKHEHEFELNLLNFFDNTNGHASKTPYDDERDYSNGDGNVMASNGDGNVMAPDNINSSHHSDSSIPRFFTKGQNSSNIGDEPQTMRKSGRVRNLPPKFNDYVMPHNKNEPKSYKEAILYKTWIEAMNNEMESLFRNNTWVLVDLPPNKKTIGCKWIWKIKYKSTGDIERYKARLVAKGYSQRNRIDYEETFSHVVKMVTVRCIIILVVHNKWPLFQFDVYNAFQYGDLHEDVYMDLPSVYYDPFETKSINDYSLFVKHDLDVILVLLVYVDDIVKTVLENKNGLCLSQRKYCMELLSEYGLLACKPVATPMQQNHMHPLLQSHFTARLRVLRYLKQSPGSGIQFFYRNKIGLHAYSDADWAKCLILRKSISGFCVYLCGNLVSCKSKKQATISRSLTKAEYRCMTSTTCEILWLINMLSDMGVKGLLLVLLYCVFDSTSAIQIAANHVFHEKTKHFEIDVHLVREKVASGAISTVKINSAENVVDVFTKGFSISQHKHFYLMLNMVDMFEV
ncbi:putative RNA-directed DNA polymerase [Tanacetum coccineum]